MVDRWCTKLAYHAALFGHFSKFNAKLQDKSENIHRQNLGVYGQAFPVAWGFETGLHGHVPTGNSCTKGSQRACCFCLTPSDIKIKVGRLFSMCGWHWGLLLNLRPIQPGILNGGTHFDSKGAPYGPWNSNLDLFYIEQLLILLTTYLSWHSASVYMKKNRRSGLSV